jgi:prepilin-type N-terminal cleavage/methylation domain-containing protein
LNPINMYSLKKSGFTLVEVVVASAIIVTGVLALSEGYTRYVKFAQINEKNIQAVYLAEEGLEAMTHIRDQSWASIRTLSTSSPRYIYWNSTRWQTTTTPEYVDAVFLRSFTIGDVYRNGSDQIASSGTYDPDTKYITVNVAYKQGQSTTTKTLSTYLTNIYAE